MYTAFSNIIHAIPCQVSMPTLKDDLGAGSYAFRRKQMRPLGRWALESPPEFPGEVDRVIGLLQYVQGDTPFWWDGGGFGEVHDPMLFALGNGTVTDYRLPHRFVNIA